MNFNRFGNFGNFGNMNYGQGGILSTIVKAMILFIVYLVVNWYSKSPKITVNVQRHNPTHHLAEDLPENTQAVTIPTRCIYVHDWNKKYGSEKASETWRE